ncbi:unannotated protein [freshwater metagenome]|uniref:Unannotated protein n=1 Tax=freshwater metagenome TaxID=449393 RepID=A0A6J7ABG4_9ZZZZ
MRTNKSLRRAARSTRSWSAVMSASGSMSPTVRRPRFTCCAIQRRLRPSSGASCQATRVRSAMSVKPAAARRPGQSSVTGLSPNRSRSTAATFASRRLQAPEVSNGSSAGSTAAGPANSTSTSVPPGRSCCSSEVNTVAGSFTWCSTIDAQITSAASIAGNGASRSAFRAVTRSASPSVAIRVWRRASSGSEVSSPVTVAQGA